MIFIKLASCLVKLLFTGKVFFRLRNVRVKRLFSYPEIVSVASCEHWFPPTPLHHVYRKECLYSCFQPAEKVHPKKQGIEKPLVFSHTLFLENEAQIIKNNYGTMFFMSKQDPLLKILLQEVKIGRKAFSYSPKMWLVW